MIKGLRAIVLAVIYFTFAAVFVSADYTITVEISSSEFDFLNDPLYTDPQELSKHPGYDGYDEFYSFHIKEK